MYFHKSIHTSGMPVESIMAKRAMSRRAFSRSMSYASTQLFTNFLKRGLSVQGAFMMSILLIIQRHATAPIPLPLFFLLARLFLCLSIHLFISLSMPHFHITFPFFLFFFLSFSLSLSLSLSQPLHASIISSFSQPSSH